jgi:intracellular multiplication protein IcmX
MSVSFSNLYYILSKRMPQITPNNTSTTPTSQALSEFNMATWRLVRLDKKDNSPVWMQKINGASSATIQKEMAVLLAEINYQLYLNRQQEERLLLTNTMLLIQNARSGQPDASALAPDTTGDSDATSAGDIPAS